MLFDEAFLRSGYHPVAMTVDPTLLKSAVANDPELEVAQTIGGYVMLSRLTLLFWHDVWAGGSSSG